MEKLKVLLVDDNQGFIALSLHVLSSMNAVEVIGWGYDGFDGVRLAAELNPDVVIMDLVMPGMGGLQATRIMKTQYKPPLIAIASYYDDVPHREHAATAGADGFIGKDAYQEQIALFFDQMKKPAQKPASKTSWATDLWLPDSQSRREHDEAVRSTKNNKAAHSLCDMELR